MPRQGEERQPPVGLRIEELRDGVPRERPRFEALLHGGTDLGQRMLFQQPQHADVFAGAIAVALRLQPAVQEQKTFRQCPARRWR